MLCQMDGSVCQYLCRQLRGSFQGHSRSTLDMTCDAQTDGRTDILIANAALDYVVRPNIIFSLVLAPEPSGYHVHSE